MMALTVWACCRVLWAWSEQPCLPLAEGFEDALRSHLQRRAQAREAFSLQQQAMVRLLSTRRDPRPGTSCLGHWSHRSRGYLSGRGPDERDHVGSRRLHPAAACCPAGHVNRGRSSSISSLWLDRAVLHTSPPVARQRVVCSATLPARRSILVSFAASSLPLGYAWQVCAECSAHCCCWR